VKWQVGLADRQDRRELLSGSVNVMGAYKMYQAMIQIYGPYHTGRLKFLILLRVITNEEVVFKRGSGL
jgi:hypothetical protein